MTRTSQYESEIVELVNALQVQASVKRDQLLSEFPELAPINEAVPGGRRIVEASPDERTQIRFEQSSEVTVVARNLERALREFLKGTGEYQQLNEKLGSIAEKRNSLLLALGELLYQLAREVAVGQDSSNLAWDLSNLVSRETFEYRMIRTLFGVLPETNIIWESEAVVVEIRQPNEQEIMHRYAFRGYGPAQIYVAEPTCTLIVRASIPLGMNIRLYEWADKATACMQLYRSFPLQHCANWIEGPNLAVIKSVGWGPEQLWAESLVLSESDVEPLQAVISRLLPIAGILSEQNNPLGQAFSGYCDLGKHQWHAVEGVVSTMRALEALLLTKAEDEGITKALSHRCSLIADVLGFDYSRVRECVRKGYAIRSRYVHGDGIHYEKLASFKEASNEVFGVHGFGDFLRRVLVLCLLLQPDGKKSQLIERMQNAMVNVQARRDLDELIRDRAAGIEYLIYA